MSKNEMMQLQELAVCVIGMSLPLSFWFYLFLFILIKIMSFSSHSNYQDLKIPLCFKRGWIVNDSWSSWGRDVTCSETHLFSQHCKTVAIWSSSRIGLSLFLSYSCLNQRPDLENLFLDTLLSDKTFSSFLLSFLLSLLLLFLCILAA